MSKSIQLTRRQWETLKEQLKKDYSPSVVLIRSKMKERLGFVERHHRWTEDMVNGHGNIVPEYKNAVMLDFYSEKKCTWFLMKYGDFVNE